MIFDAITYLCVLGVGIALCLDGRRTSYHLLGTGLVFLAVRFLGKEIMHIYIHDYNGIWTRLILASQFVYGVFQSLIWLQIFRLIRSQFMLLSRTNNIDIPTDFINRND